MYLTSPNCFELSHVLTYLVRALSVFFICFLIMSWYDVGNNDEVVVGLLYMYYGFHTPTRTAGDCPIKTLCETPYAYQPTAGS